MDPKEGIAGEAPVTEEFVRGFLATSGIKVDPAELSRVTAQAASFMEGARTLATLDLDASEPRVVFDPRWNRG